ncbi:LysR substrate-binding domain-containing protein [Rhizobium sp. G21]|uniref:LysR substrate-binding domain-containing protein n=1 Tax=Rhizobium sp. G21 TaxID=2758439 RepID=UPI001602EEE8|nr:LysR substrate-binding domain-containing protein [Rhizobium sp. G21]MBB1250956.1 LysR family transcriptional regulator [Rhizobium sp. G21]
MVLAVESIGAMQAFVQAADKRSFKLAGQVVGLTPSAVGKAIQKLEDQLGVRLFHRSTRSVTITDEGLMFLDRCRRILAEVEAAQAELANAGAAPQGRLKISLPVEPTLILPIVAEFNEAYPDIELDLDINDRFVDVIEEGFDAVIRSGAPKDSRLLHRKLGEFVWRFVASPDYVARCGAPAAVSELVNHRCLRHRYPETGRLLPWPVEPDLETAGVPVTITASMMGPLLELAVRGRGIAFLPHFAVDQQIASGSLVEVLPGQSQNSGSLHLLWPASRYPLPKVRVFVDFLTTRMMRALAERRTGDTGKQRSDGVCR